MQENPKTGLLYLWLVLETLTAWVYILLVSTESIHSWFLALVIFMTAAAAYIAIRTTWRKT